MAATCNGDCCNRLCLPVLFVESAVSVLSDSPLRKTKKNASPYEGNLWDYGRACCVESLVKHEQTRALGLEWLVELICFFRNVPMAGG